MKYKVVVELDLDGPPICIEQIIHHVHDAVTVGSMTLGRRRNSIETREPWTTCTSPPKEKPDNA
jgi:hypothetical protein